MGRAYLRHPALVTALALALGWALIACGGGGGDGRPGGTVAGVSAGGLGGSAITGGGTGAGTGTPVGGAPPAGSGGTPAGGGFDAGSAADRNTVSAGEICDRLATIQCAGEQACCPDPGRGFDACKSMAKKGCTDNLQLDVIARDPITGYDEGGARMAFDELERRSATCDPTVAQWAVSTAGFVTAFKGTRVENQPCTPPTPSSFGQLFDRNSPEQVAALASCMDGANVVCLPALGPWICKRRAGSGGGCVFDGNCQDGLYCADTGFITDSCRARKADGADCSTANECAHFICKGGKCAEATVPNAYCLAALQ